MNKVSDKLKLEKEGLREMEEKDIPEVTALYASYMKRFGMALQLTEDEVRHQFLSGRGEGPGSWRKPREGQVIWTYVVEVGLKFLGCLLNIIDATRAEPTNTQDHRLRILLLSPIDNHEPTKAQRPLRRVSLLLCHNCRI